MSSQSQPSLLQHQPGLALTPQVNKRVQHITVISIKVSQSSAQDPHLQPVRIWLELVAVKSYVNCVKCLRLRQKQDSTGAPVFCLLDFSSTGLGVSETGTQEQCHLAGDPCGLD